MKTTRRLVGAIFGVLAGNAAHNKDKQDAGYQHLHHVFGHAEVVHLHTQVGLAGGIYFYDLLIFQALGAYAFGLQLLQVVVGHQVKAIVRLVAVVKLATAEKMPLALGIQNHRQGKRNSLATNVHKMEIVGIGHVLNDHFTGVEGLFVAGGVCAGFVPFFGQGGAQCQYAESSHQ